MPLPNPFSTRRRRGVALLGAAAATVALAITVPLPATASAPADPVAAPADAVTTAFYAHAAADLARTGVPSYTGLHYDAAAGTVDVYLTGRDPQVEARLAGASPAGMFRFHVVGHSRDQLQAISNQIGTDGPALAAAGLRVVYWGVDETTGRLRISVPDVAAETAGLQARYGADTIEVVPAGTEPHLADRLYDHTPWTGGDFITAGNDCSSGPPVLSNVTGTHYLLTAAHCYALNTTVKNGSAELSVAGTTMGTVSSRDNTNAIDTEVIRVDSRAYDWSTYNATRHQYDYIYTSLVGDTGICASGAFEYEKCGGTVTQADICSYFNGTRWYFCHLSVANIGTGQTYMGDGDSGSPVYSANSTGDVIRGTMTGVGVTSGNFWLCPTNNPHGDRTCGNQLYFTNIGNILDDWNVRLVI